MSERVVVTGQAALVARMRRIRNGLPDAIFGIDIEQLLLRRVLHRFEQSVAPDGAQWPALKETTVRRKKWLGSRRPDKALERTEKLVRSIRVISGGTRGLLAASTGIGFRIGVSDHDAAAYGRLHQYGIGDHLPARPFIGISSGDVAAVRAFAQRRLRTLVG